MKHREHMEINLIPYIDILLVLVLILMLSSSLSYQVHDVNLPTSSQMHVDPDAQSAHLILNTQGQLTWKHGAEDKVIGLLNQLKPEDLSFLDAGALYTIDADRDIPYQNIIDLLALLKSCKIEKVALAIQSQ